MIENVTSGMETVTVSLMGTENESVSVYVLSMRYTEVVCVTTVLPKSGRAHFHINHDNFHTFPVIDILSHQHQSVDTI